MGKEVNNENDLGKKMPGYMKYVLSGAAGMCGLMFVQPMDLVKTRMQMTGIGGAKKEYKSASDCLRKTIRNEGILKCWHGVSAGLLRQATYTATRMGVYQSLIDVYRSQYKHSPTMIASMGMGALAGAIGSFVGTPADVALIRMVTDGKLPPAEKRGYTNVFNALMRIYREEGITGLWKGCTPTVSRAVVVSTVQLSSYSQTKKYLRKGPLQMKDGTGLHTIASFIAGFFTAVASLPVDIAKTRIQNMKMLPGGKPEYSGAVDVLVRVYRKEGPLSLWKGLTPYFIRIAPLTVLVFVFLEEYTRLYYKYVLKTVGGSNL